MCSRQDARHSTQERTVRIAPELADLLATHAGREFAADLQLAAAAGFLRTVDRQAAARRLLTHGEAARERGVRLILHLAEAGAAAAIPAGAPVRTTFAQPHDAVVRFHEWMKESAERLRRCADLVEGDSETAALVGELLREVEGALVESEIMARCPGVPPAAEESATAAR
jgi:hypothetical protein